MGILGWWFFSSSSLYWIAQGLGAVEGKAATNSLEAFKESYKKGFRVFEIDLRLTKDDEVCASAEEAAMATDKKKFLATKVMEKYEPLCLEGLTRLLKEYPEAFFVLDVNPTKDPNETYRRIYQKLFRAWSETTEFWTRVFPQIYQETDLGFLKGFYRFHSVIYNVTRTKSTDDALVMFVAKSPEVSAVAMSKTMYSSTIAKEARREKRQVYVIGVNQLAESKAFIAKGATGFFTDTLNPLSQVE